MYGHAKKVDANGHEFIEVGNLRWCLGCGLFQMRKDGTAIDFPWPNNVCPRTTPYAHEYDFVK